MILGLALPLPTVPTLSPSLPHLPLPLVNGQLQKVPVAALIPTVTVQGNHWYNVSYFEGEDPEIVWPDGTPLDGTPIEVEHYPFLAVMAIIYTYCVLGVLFALACFMFNLAFHKKK